MHINSNLSFCRIAVEAEVNSTRQATAKHNLFGFSQRRHIFESMPREPQKFALSGTIFNSIKSFIFTHLSWNKGDQVEENVISPHVEYQQTTKKGIFMWLFTESERKLVGLVSAVFLLPFDEFIRVLLDFNSFFIFFLLPRRHTAWTATLGKFTLWRGCWRSKNQ